MKPILIDAIHINMGGALMILNHLVNCLVEKSINFVLLKDGRCPKLLSEDKIHKMEVLPSSAKVRNVYYKRHKDDYSKILCLGNVPPPIKLPVPVHTYIHNVNLLEIPRGYPIKWIILNYLKRYYIRFYANNTDTWIVQTKHTASLVRKYLPCSSKDVLIYPFYYIPKEIDHTPMENRHDYVFIGENTYVKGHKYLIEAWVKLHKMGINPKLHLTISDLTLCRWIEELQTKGTNIVNHGRIPFDEVIALYNNSKATVYPSLNESLGLGIIEAMAAGCDVIGCDLPYTYCVCKPSATFAPCNPQQIVDAVLKYEKDECHRTVPMITDKVDEFIAFLYR